ncbi:glycerophosphodiester phosphodiesterase family protein [Saccharibacillus sp. CPCC 101409]|uniref:glycerophosphodiester phosphodiesterase n=1 Tax=Saccharibacillus sp. CPCC 101409 TaxID=3058041 RepID=UPI0026716C1A|nr:glycerophosphodiester phosphodiesterase family protein [Saccharibacillus sp. CPCC 101409]MDO3408973.1 glycerophosphodiester phosphodiesterase family protein [Saccharibacillus sp. CPCC 101409]
MLNNPCVAHRGFSGAAPENTLAAIRLAMKIEEVSWIEIDVQLTRDGVPVVIHDFVLNRTTNGRGPVRERTLDELRSMDAGRWKSFLYANERIPTLDEVLTEVKGRLNVNIELKTSETGYAGLAGAVVSLVRKHSMQSDVCLTSFVPGALLEAREADPSIRRGLIIDALPADLARRLDDCGCTLLSIGYARVNAGFVRSTIERGIDIMVWTVDGTRRMRELASMHPKLMLCTNRPDRWLLARRLPEIGERARWRRWIGF